MLLNGGPNDYDRLFVLVVNTLSPLFLFDLVLSLAFLLQTCNKE